jgi:hypothetical protein
MSANTIDELGYVDPETSILPFERASNEIETGPGSTI